MVSPRIGYNNAGKPTVVAGGHIADLTLVPGAQPRVAYTRRPGHAVIGFGCAGEPLRYDAAPPGYGVAPAHEPIIVVEDRLAIAWGPPTAHETGFSASVPTMVQARQNDWYQLRADAATADLWLELNPPTSFPDTPAQIPPHQEAAVHVAEQRASQPSPATPLPDDRAASNAVPSPTASVRLPELRITGAARPIRTLYADPVYVEKATAFETRLGGYAHNHPRAKEAARKSVVRLFEVLKRAHPEASVDDVGWSSSSPMRHRPVKWGSNSLPVEFMDMLQDGNVRELMTAFFNAAYFKDSPLGLRAVLNEIVDESDWGRAAHLGLDSTALRTQAEFLNGATRSRLHAVLSAASPGKASMFAKDVFATGNVLAQSRNWRQLGQNYLTSNAARGPWPVGEQPAWGPPRTPQDFMRLGAGLSECEYGSSRTTPSLFKCWATGSRNTSSTGFRVIPTARPIWRHCVHDTEHSRWSWPRRRQTATRLQRSSRSLRSGRSSPTHGWRTFRRVRAVPRCRSAGCPADQPPS